MVTVTNSALRKNSSNDSKVDQEFFGWKLGVLRRHSTSLMRLRSAYVVMTQFKKNMPSPPRKARDGEASTKAPWMVAVDLVAPARSWGEQVFVLSRTKIPHYRPWEHFARNTANVLFYHS
jgi:hypothetical protein